MRHDTPVVFALVDLDPGEPFLLGVFATKANAEREADDWPGPCRIEILELEP